MTTREAPPTEPAVRFDTTVARVVAMLLIANSHLEPLYPRTWLAGDGLLGNSLFFLLSGFGLAASARGRGMPGFVPWFGRRLSRLYPALWIFLFLSGRPIWMSTSWLTRVEVYLWPTPFGFLMQIIPFYAVIYVLLRSRRAWPLLLAMATCVAVYFATYAGGFDTWHAMTRLTLSDLPSRMYWSLFGFMMAFGAWLPTHLKDRPPGHPWHLGVFGLLFVGYVGLKLAMVTGHGAKAFPLLQWWVLPMLYLLVRGLASPSVVAAFRARPWLWQAIGVGAAITLEVYIVHVKVAEHPFIRGLRFPINLLVFWPVALTLGWLLAKASSFLRRALEAHGERSLTGHPS